MNSEALHWYNAILHFSLYNGHALGQPQIHSIVLLGSLSSLVLFAPRHRQACL
jgi:hypothetical protein